MKQNRIRGIKVGSSSIPNREERLRAHEEFEASDLKRMLDDDWRIESARIKRPRIKRNPRKVEISIAGGWIKMVIEYPDWVEHGSIGTIIKEID